MNAFAAALLDPTLPPPADLAVRNGADLTSRFAIYRNNVTWSLIEALADTYPVVKQLVGDTFFQAMACAYVRAHLPKSPVLAYYGDAFPDFIASFPPASGVPYLADVARLEWAYVAAFHSADTTAMRLDAFADAMRNPATLANAHLRFAPCVRVVKSRFPVVSIWHAHQDDDPAARMADIPIPQAEAALLVRPAYTVQVIPLLMTAADCIAALLDGVRLGEAIEHAALPQAHLESLFTHLLQTGALCGMDIPEDHARQPS